jgi:hypothetical protein
METYINTMENTVIMADWATGKQPVNCESFFIAEPHHPSRKAKGRRSKSNLTNSIPVFNTVAHDAKTHSGAVITNRR